MQQSFQLYKRLSRHKCTVCKLARIDSRSFVSASWDHTLKIWTLDGECIATLNVGHVVSVIVLSTGMIVSASEDQSIKFWKMDGSCVHTIHVHHPIHHLLLELTGGRIVIGLLDKKQKALIYSLDGKCLLNIVQDDDDDFWTAMIQLPNGNLVTASFDGIMKIWNPQTLECINKMHKHCTVITSLCLLKQDGRFASASWDETIKIWSQSGELLECISANSILTMIALSNDCIATGSVDKVIKILNQNGKCVQVLEGHTSDVCCLLELRDGILVSASDDSSLIIWNQIMQLTRFRFFDVIFQ